LGIAGDLDKTPDLLRRDPGFPGDKGRNGLDYFIHDFLTTISPQRAQKTQRETHFHFATAKGCAFPMKMEILWPGLVPFYWLLAVVYV
jgi:hypothetical protein